MARLQLWAVSGVVAASCLAAAGQSAAPADANADAMSPAAVSMSTNPLEPTAEVSVVAVSTRSTVQQLLDFKESDVKFKLRDLMATLRDGRHEGWVLAAYPDPKTTEPLIGAGFTLDLPERVHPQTDALNTHSFIEPSSAQLWQTAGLDKEHLDKILAEYDERLAAWKKKRFQKKVKTLSPQITQDEAMGLLRASAVQATINARAYCRNFDHYTAAQQMALSQLVYQMGVNLGEFTEFLGLINSDSSALPAIAALPNATALPVAEKHAVNGENGDAEYWKTVQTSLIESQWARLYRVRATAVIAMLDPAYADEPGMAERRVSAVLRPAVVHQRKGVGAAQAGLRSATFSKGRPRHDSSAGHGAAHGRAKARGRKK